MRKGVLIGLVAGTLLTGTAATAASRWLITSTRQIKPSVLRRLHGARGKTGPAGARGATGATGATGAAGGFSTANVTVITGAATSLCASGGGQCSTGGSFAACPSGGIALGGGWSGPLVSSDIGYDYPISNDTAWEVVVSNNSAITETFTPYAVCATGSGAFARARANPNAQLARDIQTARER